MNPKQIKELRTRLGLSQQGLSEKLGCRKATVTDWETGKKQISGAYLQLLKQIATPPPRLS